MKETIVDRLEKYRRDYCIETKKEFAERLGISVREYQFFECRTKYVRKPTIKFLTKLVEYTGVNREYWLFGDENYLKNRHDFKKTETTVKELIDEGYINSIDFDKDIENALMLAIKADIQHLLLKKNKDEN